MIAHRLTGRNLMPRKLVIFDFDGTLADSKESLTHMLIDFSALKGLPYDVDKLNFGYTNPLKYDLGWGVSLAEQPQLINEYIDFMRHSHSAKDVYIPRLFNGIVDVLDMLGSQYDMAVITSRDRASYETAINFHQINHFFPISRTACCVEDLQMPHKPIPDVLYHLLNETGHKAEDIVMIGDTVADIGLANNANAKSIAVTWGLHSKERLIAERPTILVDQVLNLPDTIRHLFIE